MALRLISAGSTLLDGAPTRIQYLPPGTTTVTARVDGEPDTVTVTVGPETAGLLQKALEARQQNNVRPIIDFDHHNSGPAAALPKRFTWDPEGGVMLELEWTSSGRAAIEGRDYSYFSPLFMIGNDGKPAGLHPKRPLGGLVNDPAFSNIRRIAAKHAEPNLTNKPMDQPDLTRLVEAGAITAEQAKGSDAVTALAESYTRAVNANKTLEARATEAEKERDAARAEIQAAREAEADAVITRAIEAGRIAPKDDESQAFWRSAIMTSGAPAIKQLEAKSAVSPDIAKAVIKPSGAVLPSSQKTVESSRAAKVRNRAVEIMNTQKISHSVAWDLAKAEII